MRSLIKFLTKLRIFVYALWIFNMKGTHMTELFSVLTPRLLLLVFAGSAAGLVVGALPGLSVTMATALLVSITYTWSVTDALALIMGVYVVGVFSGAVSAILINIPGAPSSIATTLDGYPMSQKGEAYKALWLATVFSFIGSVVGFLALGVVTKPLSAIALKFAPMDYFLLGMLGLTTASSFTAKSPAKGAISAALGVLLGTVGIDPIVGTGRFTFGASWLMGGISLVPALIGIFGMSEVFHQVASKSFAPISGRFIRKKIRFATIAKHWWLCLYSSVVGTLIGALPGAGGPVASLIAYDHAQKLTPNPAVPFGEGAEEGIVASEAANNACIGGAFIPLLTLAVPGDAVTAVLLGVFYIHGIRPGPMLLRQSPEIFATIMTAGLVGCVALLVMGLTLAPLLARVITIPKRILLPIITLLCIIGAYAGEGKVSDIIVMAVLGLLGYLLTGYGFPTAPLVLGLVLGQMIDQNFRRAVSMAMSADNMLLALFSRPITLTLLAVLIFTAAYQWYIRKKQQNPSK